MSMENGEQLERLRHFYSRCDPARSVPADDPDGWYVDFDAKGLRGQPCITRLGTKIQLAERPLCQLFTGFSGSGKTSELSRLAKRLRDNGYYVLHVDIERHLDLTQPIDYPDVLIALGVAVDDELYSDPTNKAGQWTRRFTAEVRNLLFSKVELDKLELKVGVDTAGTQFGYRLRGNTVLLEEIRRAAGNRRDELLKQTRAYFERADKYVRTSLGYSQGLVLLVDNLEKMPTELPQIHEAAHALLLGQSRALRAPGVHTIYTFPPRLAFSPARRTLLQLYDGDPLVLPMVKVSERPSGEPLPEGIAALEDLMLRRLDVEEVFGGDLALVSALVAQCGGYARELLQLGRGAIEAALEVGQGLPLGRA
ncbi:MAG: AAA family ATPase, partial [Nannocystaceae bacterium]|nr:AAA family ATPase [Nannocystaceae bacterium]